MRPHVVGPVDFIVASIETEALPTGLLRALHRHLDAAGLRLMDAVIVRDTPTGLRIAEVDPLEFSRADLTLDAPGLAAAEDIRTVCATVPTDTSAVVLLIELSWARSLAEDLDAAGARILHSTACTTIAGA